MRFSVLITVTAALFSVAYSLPGKVKISTPSVPSKDPPKIAPLDKAPSAKPPTAKQITDAGFKVTPAADKTHYGKWAFLGVLGEGGFGKVYLGWNGKKYAAVKFVADEEMLMAEVKYQWKLSKIKGVVQLYGYINDGQQFGMVMEPASAGDLEHLIRQHPTGMPIPQAKSIFKQLSKSLAQIHKLGVVLRDIKPDNVLLFKNGNHLQAKHADFGTCDSDNAQTRAPSGTAIYMPYGNFVLPKGQYIDLVKTDTYALGLTLLCMVTGKAITDIRQDSGEGMGMPIYKKLDWTQPALAPALANMDPKLKQLLQGMLEEDAAQRWTDEQIVNSEWLAAK